MSVTLINIFEVPAGDEAEFLAAREKTRDYLKELPAPPRDRAAPVAA
jgi:hypothetical protein